MRVRILRSIATTERGFIPGSVVELDEATAREWLRAGIAEEDGSLPGPPEVKKDASRTRRGSRK